MIINRENYEQFIVDFAEGNLPPDLAKEMERFVKANSDIKEELEMFLEAPIVDKSVMFDGKDQLKKIPFEKTSVYSDYFQNQCVAYIEGVMPDSEVDLFIELIESDEEKRRELNFFRNTKLQNEDSFFNEKILLKHDETNHNVHENNFEEYCVACIERWLNQSGLIALNEYIANNPEQKETLELYHKVKVSPDLAITFPNKSALKKYRIVSLNTRKIFSYAASAAAVLVFGAMLFYSSKLDNTSTMASKIVEPGLEQIDLSIINVGEEMKLSEKQEYKKDLLSDPFGFKKVNVPIIQKNSLAESSKRVEMDKINPIEISELNCLPCKDVFGNGKKISVKKQVIIESQQEFVVDNKENKMNAANENNLIWNIAQAGVSGFNRITKANIKVEKEEETNKTKIEFQSKYFAFSTNVKQRNSY